MSSKIIKFEKDGKTHNCIELKADEESKYGFIFGLSKARLIMEHLEEIRKFIEDNTLIGE